MLLPIALCTALLAADSDSLALLSPSEMLCETNHFMKHHQLLMMHHETYALQLPIVLCKTLSVTGVAGNACEAILPLIVNLAQPTAQYSSC